MQCVELESLVVPLNPPPEFEAGRLDVGQIQALTMGGPTKREGRSSRKHMSALHAQLWAELYGRKMLVHDLMV